MDLLNPWDGHQVVAFCPIGSANMKEEDIYESATAGLEMLEQAIRNVNAAARSTAKGLKKP